MNKKISAKYCSIYVFCEVFISSINFRHHITSVVGSSGQALGHAAAYKILKQKLQLMKAAALQPAVVNDCVR